jgi:hypothetical protein
MVYSLKDLLITAINCNYCSVDEYELECLKYAMDCLITLVTYLCKIILYGRVINYIV